MRQCLIPVAVVGLVFAMGCSGKKAATEWSCSRMGLSGGSMGVGAGNVSCSYVYKCREITASVHCVHQDFEGQEEIKGAENFDPEGPYVCTCSDSRSEEEGDFMFDGACSKGDQKQYIDLVGRIAKAANDPCAWRLPTSY